jgi:alkanesulfonate monooxygenase SsuD/methylene tetrahydromethanopterin reductase-like flavin-dependent oxidoreductase (luciferase family)
MVLLPALAAATHRVTLGTMDVAVGFRPPAVLAKAAASLDRLSAGRFVLGLGAGSDEAGYVAAGLDFPAIEDRMADLEEAAILIREMTSQSHATVTGPRFRVQNAPNLPQSTQQPVPILMSAGGPHGLRAAAGSADIWHLSGPFSPHGYAVEAARFDRACHDAGTDPHAVRRSLGLVALVGEDERDVRRRHADWRQQAPGQWGTSPEALRSRGLAGTPHQVGERIQEFVALGVSELVLSFAPIEFGWCSSAGWDIVATEVLPSFGQASR